jgi:peptide chain release factor 3
MDEVEKVLKIKCAPMTWPIGSGKAFIGVYRLYDDVVHLFAGRGGLKEDMLVQGLDSPELDEPLKGLEGDLSEELELVQGASHDFDTEAYLAGELTPVFFGSALNRQGTDELMDNFVEYAATAETG